MEIVLFTMGKGRNQILELVGMMDCVPQYSISMFYLDGLGFLIMVLKSILLLERLTHGEKFLKMNLIILGNVKGL